MSHTYTLFLHATLPEKMTGIESSALKRYWLFERQLGITPIYVSYQYDLNPPRIINLYKSQGKIPPSFQFVNLYSYFQSHCDNPRLPHQTVAAPKEVKTTYQNGKRRYMECYDERGRISHINYYDHNNKRIRLDNFNRDGYQFRTTLFDVETCRVHTELFYRFDGTICYSKIFKSIKGKNVIDHICLHDKFGFTSQYFYSEEEFRVYLLNYYLCNAFKVGDLVNIIGDRGREAMFALDRTQIPATVRTYYAMHSFHLKDAANMDSDIRNIYFFLKSLDEVDGVITLAPQQKDDIIKRVGQTDKLHFIPHTISHTSRPTPFGERQPYRVIAPARLSQEKRQDVMIRIFAKVVEKLPEATLEIFGSGSLKDELEALIKTLNLTDHVFLRGYTQDIYAEFSTAKCSLMTSEYEGQPLVMLESLSCGCPVVSQDFRYGPRMMLEDGKNGFIVAQDDEEGFAQRIIEILTNDQLAQTLSANAYQSIEPFKEENVAPLWQKMMATVV